MGRAESMFLRFLLVSAMLFLPSCILRFFIYSILYLFIESILTIHLVSHYRSFRLIIEGR